MGSEARARLAFAGLAFVTLLSFNQLFGKEEFAGPSLLGMLLSASITLWCRRVGLWPSTTIGISLAAMVWYLVVIFEAPYTFYSLPTLDALRRLGSAIARSYEHSQIDFAPVPLRPGYAILTVAAMWTLMTIGEVAAFRWHRPLAASMGPIALFSFVMIVGTQAGGTISVIVFLAALLTYWALASSHRLITWGHCVPLHPRAGVAEPPIAWGLARRMGASSVAVALVLPMFLPVVEDGLLSWRSGRAGIEGGIGADGSGSSSGAVDPLVSLVPRLIRQTEQELFRVRADEASYWRLLTLSRFDGNRWSDGSSEISSIAPGGTVPIATAPPTPGRISRQRFTITGLGGNAIPHAGLPVTISAPDSVTGDLYVDPLSADIQLRDGLEEGLGYEVQGILPDASFDDLKKTEIATVAREGYYLEVPELSRRVERLAVEWTKDAATPIEKLAALQGRLRAFKYSLEVEKPTSADYLEEFLLRSRVGYCQQFATAFALLARYLGFPTRIAVGFLPGQTSIAAPDSFVVSGNETHAWPEVLFEGYGWIPFEPTPRQESPEPPYTLSELASAPTTVSGAEASTGQAGQRGREAVRGQPAPQRPLDKPLDRSRRELQGGRGTSRWQDRFGRIAGGFGILGVLFLAVVPLLKMVRIQRRYARASGTREQIDAAFAEFEQEAAELASPRSPAESAAAYGRRLAGDAGLPAPPISRLSSLYEAAQYAPGPIPALLAAEAKRLARQLRRRLWARAGWTARIKRLWSPASLMPAEGFTPVKRVVLEHVLPPAQSSG